MIISVACLQLECKQATTYYILASLIISVRFLEIA